tara:strand:+ start:13044 stop:14165 length:1122 start_codon:yes stop_codon:yes gene_type:complete
MNIGIISDFSKNPFSNGLTQNIIHLKKCLDNCGANVFYIDYSKFFGKEVDKVSHFFIKKDKLIPINDLTPKDVSKLDLILSPGVAIKQDKVNEFKSYNKKVKIANIRYANSFIQRMQNWGLFSKEHYGASEKPMKEAVFDAHLYSPHFKRFHELEEIEQRCFVGEIPYLWSPNVLNKIAADNNFEIDYKPGKIKELAVFEPNVEISKSCLVPLMAIIHLLRTNPNSFDAATVFCADKFGTSINKYINNNLNLQSYKNKIFFEGRYNIAYILDKFNPTFISHQVMCELNYVYLEALYFGYPLIHNSTMLENQGYYYQEFNAIECAQKILESQEKHDDNLQNIKQKQKDFTYQFNADNPKVINKYTNLLNQIINL